MGTEGIMHGMEHTVHLEQLHHSLIHHQSTPQRSPRIPFSPDAHLASPNLVLTHPSLSQSVLQASTCLPDLLCPTTSTTATTSLKVSPFTDSVARLYRTYIPSTSESGGIRFFENNQSERDWEVGLEGIQEAESFALLPLHRDTVEAGKPVLVTDSSRHWKKKNGRMKFG
jgi:hypothetical protein